MVASHRPQTSDRLLVAGGQVSGRSGDLTTHQATEGKAMTKPLLGEFLTVDAPHDLAELFDITHAMTQDWISGHTMSVSL